MLNGVVMRNYILIILLSIFALTNNMFASYTTIINGSANMHGKKYISLKVNGELEFKGLTIDNFLKVNGSLKGEKLMCDNLNVNGNADIKKVEAREININGLFIGDKIDITGKAIFKGSLILKNSEFKKVDFEGNKVILFDSVINKGINFSKPKELSWNIFKSTSNTPQILELRGNSAVYQDVKFDDKGEIHLYDNSIVNAKIINGKVIQK